LLLALLLLVEQLHDWLHALDFLLITIYYIANKLYIIHNNRATDDHHLVLLLLLLLLLVVKEFAMKEKKRSSYYNLVSPVIVAIPW
jgi:hypothetical protein